jgi:hypothetical protein
LIYQPSEYKMPKKKGAADEGPNDLALYQTEEGRRRLQQMNLTKLRVWFRIKF